MKRKIITSLFVAVFLVSGTSQLFLNASELDSNSVEPETYRTTVTAGRCVNMKRDHQYSTPQWKPSIYAGFVRVHNCENDSTADGYSGYVDALIELASTGGNQYKKNDAYLKKGETFYHESTNLLNGYNYYSTADWEIIDGQNTSGSKVIFSSVE